MLGMCYTKVAQGTVGVSKEPEHVDETRLRVGTVNGPPSLHAPWGSGNLLSMSSCQEQERFCPWLESVCMMECHLLKPFEA